jgi:ribokinase
VSLSPVVLVIGDINVDVAFTLPAYPEEGTEALATSSNSRLGGSGCNTAALLARLGQPTRLAGHIGKDPFGQLSWDTIGQSGVQRQWIDRQEGHASGYQLIAITQHGQRTMFGFRGCNALPYPMEQFKTAMKDAALLHLSGYTFLEQAQWDSVKELVEAARGSGIRQISLDPSVETAHRVPQRVIEILPQVDLLLVSELEALFISQQGNLDRAIEWFKTAYSGTLALKLGSQGSRIITPDQDVRLPAFHGREVSDTTGAGDSFNAGFLYGLLNGLQLNESARLGNALAYLAVTSGEGLAGVYRLPDLKAALQEFLDISVEKSTFTTKTTKNTQSP